MDGTSSAVASPAEALAGLVERVTFHNAETGFCVLRVKVRGRRKLVRAFGGAVFDLIEHQPDSLREVGPIGASAVPVRPSHLATVFGFSP